MHSGARRTTDYLGTLPGFNDSRQYNTLVTRSATTINYTLNPTTVLEGTFGDSRNELTGCVMAQANTGPSILRETACP